MPSTSPSPLGAVIREKRLARGWSQKELQRRVNEKLIAAGLPANESERGGFANLEVGINRDVSAQVFVALSQVFEEPLQSLALQAGYMLDTVNLTTIQLPDHLTLAEKLFLQNLVIYLSNGPLQKLKLDLNPLAPDSNGDPTLLITGQQSESEDGQVITHTAENEVESFMRLIRNPDPVPSGSSTAAGTGANQEAEEEDIRSRTAASRHAIRALQQQEAESQQNTKQQDNKSKGKEGDSALPAK